MTDLRPINITNARNNFLAHQQQTNAFFPVARRKRDRIHERLRVRVFAQGIRPELRPLRLPEALVAGMEQSHACDVQSEGVIFSFFSVFVFSFSFSYLLEEPEARRWGRRRLGAQGRNAGSAAHAKVDRDDLPLPLFFFALEKVKELSRGEFSCWRRGGGEFSLFLDPFRKVEKNPRKNLTCFPTLWISSRVLL